MNPQQLKQLEQAATPGPWIVEPDATHDYSGETYSWPMIATSREAARYDAVADLPYAMPLENAALIVAMRNALPALLDVAEAANDLHIEVETAESDGVCLPFRGPSLRMADALARLDDALNNTP